MSKERIEELIKEHTIKVMKKHHAQQYSGFLSSIANKKAKELINDRTVFSFEETNQIISLIEEQLQFAMQCLYKKQKA